MQKTALAELSGDQPDLGQIHMKDFGNAEKVLREQLAMGGSVLEQTIAIVPVPDQLRVAA